MELAKFRLVKFKCRIVLPNRSKNISDKLASDSCHQPNT